MATGGSRVTPNSLAARATVETAGKPGGAAAGAPGETQLFGAPARRGHVGSCPWTSRDRAREPEPPGRGETCVGSRARVEGALPPTRGSGRGTTARRPQDPRAPLGPPPARKPSADSPAVPDPIPAGHLEEASGSRGLGGPGRGPCSSPGEGGGQPLSHGLWQLLSKTSLPSASPVTV